MSFKISVIILVWLVVNTIWLIALTATTISSDQARTIAESIADHLEWKVSGDTHILSYTQQLYREELDELKEALNDQGIATSYTTEKKLYYKDKEQ